MCAALFHLWFVVHKFVLRPARTETTSFRQVVQNFQNASDKDKLVFWLSTFAVIISAALLQLSL